MSEYDQLFILEIFNPHQDGIRCICDTVIQSNMEIDFHLVDENHVRIVNETLVNCHICTTNKPISEFYGCESCKNKFCKSCHQIILSRDPRCLYCRVLLRGNDNDEEDFVERRNTTYMLSLFSELPVEVVSAILLLRRVVDNQSVSLDDILALLD